MLLKSENFMYFVVTMYRLPKQHALRTQATYTTKALALQRAKDHRATFRDTRDISSPKCRFEKIRGGKKKKKGFFFMTLTKCHIENDTVLWRTGRITAHAARNVRDTKA